MTLALFAVAALCAVALFAFGVVLLVLSSHGEPRDGWEDE